MLSEPQPLGERVTALLEVQAYGGGDDPASHAYREMAARNASIFEPAGTADVYFTYGWELGSLATWRRDLGGHAE